MQRLEKEKDGIYSFYWDTKSNSGPDQAMLFYTKDGAMIAGLAGTHLDPAETLKKLSNQVNGSFGYITGENHPPATRDAFIDLCRNSEHTNLFDGKIRIGQNL